MESSLALEFTRWRFLLATMLHDGAAVMLVGDDADRNDEGLPGAAANPPVIYYGRHFSRQTPDARPDIQSMIPGSVGSTGSLSPPALSATSVAHRDAGSGKRHFLTSRSAAGAATSGHGKQAAGAAANHSDRPEGAAWSSSGSGLTCLDLRGHIGNKRQKA